MSPQTTIRINSDLVARVRDYSEVSGVPITKCVEEAIERWLDTAAAARLLYFKRVDEEQKRAKAKTPAKMLKLIAEMEADVKKTKAAGTK
jgi:predicted DNA-binding protein